MLELFYILHLSDILTSEHIEYLTQDSFSSQYELIVLLYKKEPTLIKNTVSLLAKSGEKAHSLSEGFATLYNTQPDLIKNQAIINLLFEVTNIKSMVNIILTLYKANPKFISDEDIFKLFTESDILLKPVAIGLNILFYQNINLITKSNLILLIGASHKAIALAEALVILYKTNPDLIYNKNIIELETTSNFPLDSAEAVIILYKTDPDLIHNKNITKLLEIASNFSLNVAKALILLYKTNPNLIHNTDINQMFVNHPSNAEIFAEAVLILYAENPDLINNKDIREFLEKSSEPPSMAKAWIDLYKTNFDLIMNKNIISLLCSTFYDTELILTENKKINNVLLEIVHIEYLTNIVSILYKINPDLMTNESIIKLLMADKTCLNSLSISLERLSKKAPELITKEIIIMLGASDKAPSIAFALCALYVTNPRLVDNKNIIKLINVSNHPNYVSNVLKRLYKENPELIDNDNILKLLDSADRDVEKLAIILIHSYRINSELILNNRFIQLLYENKKSLESIKAAVFKLCDSENKWVTKDAIMALIGSGEKASLMALMLIKLHDFDLYTSENITTVQELLRQEKNSEYILNEISINMEKTKLSLVKLSIFTDAKDTKQNISSETVSKNNLPGTDNN